MRKKSNKAIRIHELAIALCEKRNVWFHSHPIRLVEVVGDSRPCYLCEMDSICDEEMVELCHECNVLLKRTCILKLVTRNTTRTYP